MMRTRLPSHQRGAALLAAMLTVTLVATLTARVLWQQWRSAEVEAAERAHDQAGWLLVGARDWARLILREDARASGQVDHLGEPWAVPLQEARLSTFLNAQESAELERDAFLSGQIQDAQAKLNVTNWVQGGQPSEADVADAKRLWQVLGLPPASLQTLLQGLKAAQAVQQQAANSTNGAVSADAGAPLVPQRIEQLTWLGLDAATLQRVAPYITLLPVRTPVNLNTAPIEVLMASLDIDRASAQKLEQARASAPLQNLGGASMLISILGIQPDPVRHSVNTQFFEVMGRIRLDAIVVQERSMMRRNGQDVQTLWRERSVAPVAALDATAK